MLVERPFAEVIEDIHAAKKTGALYVSVVQTSEDLFRVYFKDGNIYHVRYGSAVGNDCLDILEYYTLRDASFFEGFQAPEGARSVNLPQTGAIIAMVQKLSKTVKVQKA